MIGGGPQKITVEIGGKIGGSLGASLRGAQMQVSSFGRNVQRTLNDAAIAGRRGFKGMFDNALWQQAAVGAAGIGVALGASIRTAARFESVLSDIGKTANVGEAELKRLGAQILQLSGRNITNLAPEKLAAGIQDLVAQGLELNDAVASMEALGKVATATNSDLLDVTKTGYQLQNALKIRPTELKATFDALAFAGKQGAFELRDMAEHMPNIASAAGTLGITGKQGAISLAAMMQMVRKDAPDAGQAATRLTDAILKMKTAPDVAKNFKKFGVDINQVMKDAVKKGINPMEAALNQLQRITRGDAAILGQIFGDKEAKLGLISLMKYRKEYEKLKADAGGAAAAGTVDKDFQRSLATFQGTLASFQNSTQRLGVAVGKSLLPPLTRLAEFITPLVEGFASFAASNPRIATGIVLIGGAFAGLVLALPIIAGLITAIATIGTAIAAASPIIAGLGTVFVILAPPIGIAIGLIAAVAAGAYLIVRNWKTIGPFFAGLWQNVISLTQQVGPKILGLMFPIPAMIIRLFTGSGIGQKIITSIIDGLKARAAALFSWIGRAVSRISSMVGDGGGITASAQTGAAPAANNVRPIGGAGVSLPGRARGGPVRAGLGYIVGERRRELFVPGMDGGIIPRVAAPVTVAALRAMLAAPTPAAVADTTRAVLIQPPAPPATRAVSIPPQAGTTRSVTINAPVTIHATGGDPHDIRRQVEAAFIDILYQAESAQRVALHD